MALKPCVECGEQISTDARICPRCGKKSPHPPDPVAGAVLVLAVLGGLAYCSLRGDDSAPAAAQLVAAAGGAPECRLRSPAYPAAPVPVFVSADSLDEFVAAMVRKDDPGMRAAFVAGGAFEVPAGTRCSWLDRGLVQTGVRITDGPFFGRTGWVPSELARGE